MARLLAYTMFFVLCTACATESTEVRTIAISKYYPNHDYQQWVHGQDSTYHFVELYAFRPSQIDSVLRTCKGLILSGGSDIGPNRYGALDSLSHCTKIDPHRDSVELEAMAFVKQQGLPTLGVCRGMQVINVAFGGDLILDLPTERGTTMHQRIGGDAIHAVETRGRLKRISKVDAAEVNCNHHQAIKHIGSGLEVIALSPDSIIEAIHHSDSVNFPYILGVQWHPERMEKQSSLSAPVLASFLQAMREVEP